MVPRIQHGAVLRLAQRQGSRSGLNNRSSFPRPSIWGAQHRPLQPFSTCSVRQQDPRQPPVPPTEPTELPAPTPAASEPTQPEPSTAVPPTPPPPPPPKKQKPASRLAPRLILAITCTLLGAALGSSARLLLAPPVPIEPGSDEDAYTTRVLHEQAAKLPIVRALTAASAPSPPTSSSDKPQANPDNNSAEYEYEYDTWDAYTSLSPAHRAQHISAGALAGSRGVGGFQRVWRHRRSGELLSVIYFGASTTGWPGVVHGGCLATILDESCGRAAFQEWGGRAGVTASLGLEYKKVTLANGFYVVRVRVRPEEELPEGERGKRHYKCWVDATVEDPVSGQVNVAAQALFVGGRGKKGKGGNGEVKGGWRIVGGGAEGGEGEEGLLKGNAKDAHIRF